MNLITRQGLFNKYPVSLFVICADFDDDSDVEVDKDSDERNQQEGIWHIVFWFLLLDNNSYIILLYSMYQYTSVYSLCS